VCLTVINSVACQRPKHIHSAASILRLCEAVKVRFSDPYKNVGKTKVLYNFKIVSVLTFTVCRLVSILGIAVDLLNWYKRTDFFFVYFVCLFLINL
jgi:hypothetical protein